MTRTRKIEVAVISAVITYCAAINLANHWYWIILSVSIVSALIIYGAFQFWMWLIEQWP